MDIDGLDDVPGTVSIWYGPVGSAEPWYARAEHVTHYAASTMKVAVLLAAQHAHETGRLDLDTPVPVTDRFASAVGGDFVLARARDDDSAVWGRLRPLAAPEAREDRAKGLPPHARIAHKSGWVTGIRHGAAVVDREGGRRYLLVVCTTTTLPDGAARALLARVAAWSFEQAGA